MSIFDRWLGFNSSRVRLWQEIESFALMVPDGALVLDAGAGEAPYKSLFSHARYESADFEQVDKPYARSTYVCDLKSIPVADERFDYIVFNQVMEHLPEPKEALKELNRVLRPGGKIIYTGPFFYEEHEQPYDFFRYTQFGLRYLFDASGFTVERLEWLEGYFGTVGYQLNSMSKNLPYKPSAIGGSSFVAMVLAPVMVILKIAFALSSILFHKLEIRSKYTSLGYPKNYIAVVTKQMISEKNVH